jgi:hypothetical protein
LNGIVVVGTYGKNGVSFTIMVLGDSDEQTVFRPAACALNSAISVDNTGKASYWAHQTFLCTVVKVSIEIAASPCC